MPQFTKALINDGFLLRLRLRLRVTVVTQTDVHPSIRWMGAVHLSKLIKPCQRNDVDFSEFI
jgi:hypothetical protein